MDASGDTSDLVDVDNLTTNGVIHVIDDMLFPTSDSLADLAIDDLSILKEAVVVAGLTDALEDEDANLTVFAPTNAAFEKLFVDLEISKQDLLSNKYLLRQVLTYHVVNDDRIFASEIEAGSQTMLNGIKITFDDNKQITDAANQEINITLANNQASNGVAHIIDTVILPSGG